MQDQRLDALQKGDKVPAALEKRYEKVRHELVVLMDDVHLNNSRIEELVEHLYEVNRAIMGLEGKLLRLAVKCKIKREDFLEQYFGNELDPGWAERVAKLPGKG